VFPIPGTRRPSRVDENAVAAGLRLDARVLDRHGGLARPGLAEGATLL
jgi:aryl-alcohol dehydrogenase-like predicted oxidoreductase